MTLCYPSVDPHMLNVWRLHRTLHLCMGRSCQPHRPRHTRGSAGYTAVLKGHSLAGPIYLSLERNPWLECMQHDISHETASAYPDRLTQTRCYERSQGPHCLWWPEALQTERPQLSCIKITTFVIIEIQRFYRATNWTVTKCRLIRVQWTLTWGRISARLVKECIANDVNARKIFLTSYLLKKGTNISIA